MNTWKEYYGKNWTTEFEGGPKHIYLVDGNSECSDFHTALSTQKYDLTFATWRAFAKHLMESKNYYDEWTRDYDNEEDDEKQLEFKSTKAFFKHITSTKQMDPIIFVLEGNILLT